MSFRLFFCFNPCRTNGQREGDLARLGLAGIGRMGKSGSFSCDGGGGECTVRTVRGEGEGSDWSEQGRMDQGPVLEKDPMVRAATLPTQEGASGPISRTWYLDPAASKTQRRKQ